MELVAAAAVVVNPCAIDQPQVAVAVLVTLL
jgi:hypothetical protein